MKNTIKDLTIKLFDNLWVDISQIDILENNSIFEIKIITDDSWLLIGKNGKNYEAILNILKIILRKNLEEKIKISLEINDYLKTKDDIFKNKILEIVKEVEINWYDKKLWFHSAYERKKIHSIVAELENKNIFTKSVWEGIDRRIYICKLEKKLTIDIDWDNI